MLQDERKAISKLFIRALLLDVTYQILVQRFVYVSEAVVVAITLAKVPHLNVQGPVNRIAHRDCSIRKECMAGH